MAAESLSALLAPLGGPAPAELSWRQPALPDWRLVLADRTYEVHTAILGDGGRRSDVLHAQFKNWADGDEVRSTILTNLIPELCHPTFEQVLDFVYTGRITLAPESVALVFKTAHVLAMQSLAREAISYLQSSCTADAAHQIYAHSLQLQPGLDQLVAWARQTVAANLKRYDPATFVPFPLHAMVDLLQEDVVRQHALPVEISTVVAAYLRSTNEREVFDRLHGFVEKMRPEDALLFLSRAVEHGNDELRERCTLAIFSGFFGKLPIEDLVAIPSHEVVVELLDADGVCSSEDHVFDAIAEYIRAKASELTLQQREELWATCRFAFLSPKKLTETVAIAGIPQYWYKLGLVGRTLQAEGTAEALAEFIAEHAAADEAAGRRLTRRRRQHCGVNLVFESAFDINGVLYHIGTQGGTREYRNPAASGDVLVKWSSRVHGSLETFVQHRDLSHHVGLTDNIPSSWMSVDLGSKWRLLPTHYCLRSNFRGAALRHWKLQGSIDESSWLDLRLHQCDASLSGPGSTAHWQVDAQHSFRFFRILQVGPNSFGTHLLACGGIELYGLLEG